MKTWPAVVLSALLLCGLTLPARAREAAQSRPAGLNAIPGYYDPALRSFKPLDEMNSATATSYNLTVTFQPRIRFQSAFQKEFTTIRCYLDVDYLSASTASATNDYSPSDVVSLSVNIAFRANNPKQSIFIRVECTGLDVFDEEHDYDGEYEIPLQSGNLTYNPIIAF